MGDMLRLQLCKSSWTKAAEETCRVMILNLIPTISVTSAYSKAASHKKKKKKIFQILILNDLIYVQNTKHLLISTLHMWCFSLFSHLYKLNSPDFEVDNNKVLLRKNKEVCLDS